MDEFLNFFNFKFYETLESYNNHVLTVELSELDIDDKESYVLDCYLQALHLFEMFFSNSTHIIFVVNTVKDEGIVYRPRRIKSYLKNKKIVFSLNCLETECFDGRFEKYIHYYSRCMFGDIDYKKLILHLCQHEMGYGIKSMDDYYFIHLEKNFCFRMLDDRFIDIIFRTNEDKLKFLEEFPEFLKFKEFVPEV
ncbi:MAG: hypothetical protein H9W80_09840 [Enterococcus sp.]|nr:hypothetical protein [Enterococcus sp.]